MANSLALNFDVGLQPFRMAKTCTATPSHHINIRPGTRQTLALILLPAARQAQHAMAPVMRIPSLPFAPKDWLRYPSHARLPFQDGSGEVPTPAHIADMHDAIRTRTLWEVERALDGVAGFCHVTRFGLLFMAIEPGTGNSLLHTAFDAQRLDVVKALSEFRTHSIMAYAKPMYAALTYQRHNGDSILHSAVRSGKLEPVRAVFDLFPYMAISAFGESVFQSDEAVEEAVPLGGLGLDDDVICMGELSFILKRNSEGRTAAEEARALGYPDLAAWLDRAVRWLHRAIRWLDGPEVQSDESILQLWREGIEQYYGLPYQPDDSI